MASGLKVKCFGTVATDPNEVCSGTCKVQRAWCPSVILGKQTLYSDFLSSLGRRCMNVYACEIMKLLLATPVTADAEGTLVSCALPHLPHIIAGAGFLPDPLHVRVHQFGQTNLGGHHRATTGSGRRSGWQGQRSRRRQRAATARASLYSCLSSRNEISGRV